jgi:hypothetical protein
MVVVIGVAVIGPQFSGRVADQDGVGNDRLEPCR